MANFIYSTTNFLITHWKIGTKKKIFSNKKLSRIGQNWNKINLKHEKKINIHRYYTFDHIGSKRQKSEIFITDGSAIKGYDPVPFFKESKPVKGSEKISSQYKDALWHFSSIENLESFKKSPEKYAPQNGGYCANGADEGHKAPTQTDTWTIVNGKLYFN